MGNLKMRTGKLNYFHHRGQVLSKDIARIGYGFREIRTLITLLSTIREDVSLTGKSIVDLGCGDRYLENAIKSAGGFYYGFDIFDALETSGFSYAACSAGLSTEYIKVPAGTVKITGERTIGDTYVMHSFAGMTERDRELYDRLYASQGACASISSDTSASASPDPEGEGLKPGSFRSRIGPKADSFAEAVTRAPASHATSLL